MEIRSIEAIPLEYDLGEGNGLGGSRGVTTTRTATLVRVTAADGTVGWGEAFAPIRAVTPLIEGPFADAVEGRSPWEADGLADEVYAGDVAGYHFARDGIVQAALTGVEVAMWDLLGKAVGEPVRAILGGESHDTVTPYASTMYFTQSEQDSADPIERAREEGFTAAKVKLGGGVDDDVRRVRTAREGLGADAHLMVDYNGNYTPKQAVASIRAIAEYDLTWVEEPVPPENEAGYREVGRKTDVPLAAGEAHFGRFACTDLLRDGLVDVIQPNLGRCGGFAEARYLARVATTANAVVRPHVWNSGVGTAAALQFLATVPTYPHARTVTPETRLFEVDRSENPLRTDLLADPFDPTGGRLTVPDAPGLGVDVDSDALDRYRLE